LHKLKEIMVLVGSC